MNTTLETTKSGTRSVLLFRVSGVLCGIDVLEIQEVRKDFEITPVPLAPEYVRGVMNLRGEIATIFDLALRLEIRSGEDGGKKSQVIVLKNRNGEYIGLLVDDIHDVTAVQNSEVALPGRLSNINEKYVEGISRQEEDLVALLKLETILAQNK